MTRWTRAAWWVMVVVLCVAPSVRYLGGDIHPFNVANADMLAVPAVLDSVRTDGLGVLADWYWPPAPYFVLDFVLYVPIWLVLPDPWLAPAVFMVVQLGLTIVALTWLAAALLGAPVRGPRARWSAAGSFALLVVLAVEVVDPARFILVSYYRGGSYALTLLVLGALVGARRWSERRAAPVLAAIVLGATVLALSDPLLLPVALAPAALVVVLLGALPERRGGFARGRASGLPYGLAIGIGGCLGLLANRWLVSSETTYGPALSGATPLLQVRRLGAVLWDVDPRLLATAGVAASLLVASVVVRRRRTGSWRADALTVALGFWCTSLVGHVAGIAVDTTPPANRYLLVALLLPIALAGPASIDLCSPAVRRLRAEGRRVTAWGAALGLGAACAVGVPALAVAPQLELRGESAEAACLDRALPTDEVRTGVASYWGARVIRLRSEHERRVAVLTGLGVPFKVNAATEWFDERWTFAVFGPYRGWEPPRDLIRTYAPDAEETRCGAVSVLVFDPIDPAPLDEVGEQLRWSACDLRTDVGRVDADRCRVVVPAGVWGFGSYGGYTPLEPGRYELTLRYRTEEGATPEDAVAVLEVLRSTDVAAQAEVEETHRIPGTGGERRRFSITLEVPDDQRPYAGEVRTFTVGTFGYEIDGLVIERVG